MNESRIKAYKVHALAAGGTARSEVCAREEPDLLDVGWAAARGGLVGVRADARRARSRRPRVAAVAMDPHPTRRPAHPSVSSACRREAGRVLGVAIRLSLVVSMHHFCSEGVP